MPITNEEHVAVTIEQIDQKKFLVELSEFIEYYGADITTTDIQNILVDRIYHLENL